MLDYFLTCLFWASIAIIAFFAILVISDWIITWKAFNEENQDENSN